MNTPYLRRTSGLLTLAVLAILVARPATADFELLDDFEAYPLGDVQDDSDSPWGAHNGTGVFTIREEGENQFLGYAWSEAQRAGSRSLPADLQVASGEQATLFLQFRAGGLSGDQSAHFGLAHNVSTSSHAPTDDFRVETRLVPGPTPDEYVLEVRDGGEYRALTTVIQDSWYSLWYVIDRTDRDTFRLYLNATGNDGTVPGPTEANLLGYEENGANVTQFSFRDTGTSADVLDGFLAHGQASATRGMHLDNLWIDKSGENVSFVRRQTIAQGLAVRLQAVRGSLQPGLRHGH